ncbi:HPr family phosphocarrier protein [Anaerocolumna xylanovorans]|uniref:Phosphocarrier protein n=1 Tax=Anaerocolumna xylanovorans DSM 12503 TaxID=1121345 RepID=A0A1M7Y0X1_9FIRM|nr:HPr family phosphocarrier protein [Anaerocolumna xylanovorans]SHO45299.1 phosphocarrier protein [Anaerocolumna xylanovorans DSM 12503]
MLSFVYTIKDKQGVHARPAGLLVKSVKELDSKVTIQKGEEATEGTRLMALMGMGIKCGEEVTVIAEGGDEEKSLAAMRLFFEENL